MLTGYQVEVVAARGENGELLCLDDALKGATEVQRAAWERGLASGIPYEPVIRYQIDEEESYEAERLWEYLSTYTPQDVLDRFAEWGDKLDAEERAELQALATTDDGAFFERAESLFWDKLAEDVHVHCDVCGCELG